MLVKKILSLMLFVCVLAAVPVQARPGRKIKLQVRDTDIRDVLLVLAKTAKTNILIAKSVRGKVSLELVDVPALTAIGLVARINRFRVAMVEGVVCVGAKEDIANLRNRGDYALHQLQHARAADMAAIVGKIYKDVDVVEDPRTNTIIITGKP